MVNSNHAAAQGPDGTANRPGRRWRDEPARGYVRARLGAFGGSCGNVGRLVQRAPLMQTSRSEQTSHNVRAADEALRRKQNRLTFPSVRAGLSWFFEARERMQYAKPTAPNTVPVMVRDGSGELRATGRHVVRPHVQGGTGGDLDDILATLHDVHEALESAKRAYPVGAAGLVLSIRDGKAQAAVALAGGISQQALSVEMGRAEVYLRGRLSGAGIVR